MTILPKKVNPKVNPPEIRESRNPNNPNNPNRPRTPPSNKREKENQTANSPDEWDPSPGNSSWPPDALPSGSGSSPAERGAEKRIAPPSLEGPPAKRRLVVSARNTPSPPLDEPNVDGGNGYNSEDEYSHLGVQLTEEEWTEKDRRFERSMKKKEYIIKKMGEDGSCLFRAVADQIFGDQEMHQLVRNQCMDYILQNSDYFSQYLTENIQDYVERKRFNGVHGNHLEIQALSEMYNRPIHIYCYSLEPINIFQNKDANGVINAPIRLCYHREVHYNSLVDPNSPSIGVGLGLPGLKPGVPVERNHVEKAMKASHNEEIEKAMLEDKIKATDWEATNEVIEEQVARESYLQWLRDNERRNSGIPTRSSASATVTSGDLRSSSPKGLSSPKAGPSSNNKLNLNGLSSPKAGCSSDRDSPKPGSSQQYNNKNTDYGLGSNFKLLENASFINGLPPDMFGLDNWNEADVLTQVLAASQQEYLDSLKKESPSSSPPPKPASSDPPNERKKGGDSPKNKKKD